MKETNWKWNKRDPKSHCTFHPAFTQS